MAEPPSEQPWARESLCYSQNQFETSGLLHAARFMSEDSDRRVFRRFDELRIFVLLRLQHRLAAMDTKIKDLHKEHDDRTRKGETDPEKDDALNCLAIDVGRVLKDYDDAFFAQSRFESLRGLSGDFVQAFLEYCSSKHKLLPRDLGTSDGVKDFQVDALASTVTREKSAVHRMVDNHGFLKRFFHVKSKQRGASVFVYSESAIRRVERMFVHVSFCVLLLCPIIALSFIGNMVGKLFIIVGFLLAAAFLTSGVLTGANNAGLAVLAGYGAILIFFLGVKVDLSSSN